MAYTTFHDRLMADAVLPATLRTLLDLDHADAVYDARRKRAVKLPVEVAVEEGATENRTPSAGNEVHSHTYALRIWRRAIEEASQSGAALKELAKADVRAVVRGLDGTAPWATALAGDVVAVEVRERTIDELPGRKGVVESVVDVTIYTLGSGDLEVEEEEGP